MKDGKAQTIVKENTQDFDDINLWNAIKMIVFDAASLILEQRAMLLSICKKCFLRKRSASHNLSVGSITFWIYKELGVSLDLQI